MASEKGGNSTRQSSQIWASPGRHSMYPTTSLPPQRGSCKLSVTKLSLVTPHFPWSIGSTLITFSILGSTEDHNIKSCPFKSLPSNLSQHYGIVINSALHSVSPAFFKEMQWQKDKERQGKQPQSYINNCECEQNATAQLYAKGNKGCLKAEQG